MNTTKNVSRPGISNLCCVVNITYSNILPAYHNPSWQTIQVNNGREAGSGDSPQGDRKGPHPAPPRPRPYYEDERIVTPRRS